ncbi:MAG: ABC transporter ATP-binding protein [Candidatus Babeliales bacterium]|nr:ABC transporter ATP-binding protein [Candidatus Babeliales bacterium]
MSNEISVLNVNNLSKTFPTKYGSFTAIDGISFNLKPGEILGLLGPNGAGKTTTIQILLSTLTATSGTINLLGKDFFKARSECLQHVGFASAYVNLPEHLTVNQNLDVHGRLFGLAGQLLKDKIEKFLKAFDAWNFRNKYVRELSAGQKSRVMLAKAFMTNPKIILLDEPTAALDPEIANEVRKFILKEKQEQNLSILFTSHNMEEVTQICDRVLVMKNGKIIANDTPDNLVNTIKLSHLYFMMDELNLRKAIYFANSLELKNKVQDKWLDIKIEESKIAEFLMNLTHNGISFSQIYITRPTLEDYFLKISHDEITPKKDLL